MSAPSLIPSKTKPQDTKKVDRIDLRLYNAIVVFDAYVVSRSPEAARDTLIAAIASGDVKPMEVTSTETRMANSIRSSWVEEKPFIGGDISDEEFNALKGTTTMQCFERFYTKRG